MRSDLDALAVARRLAALRDLYVPESLAEARIRLERERPSPSGSFADAVERRLGELRALDDLARYLHAPR